MVLLEAMRVPAVPERLDGVEPVVIEAEPVSERAQQGVLGPDQHRTTAAERTEAAPANSARPEASREPPPGACPPGQLSYYDEREGLFRPCPATSTSASEALTEPSREASPANCGQGQTIYFDEREGIYRPCARRRVVDVVSSGRRATPSRSVSERGGSQCRLGAIVYYDERTRLFRPCPEVRSRNESSRH
jgi:hypothetical protein